MGADKFQRDERPSFWRRHFPTVFQFRRWNERRAIKFETTYRLLKQIERERFKRAGAAHNDELDRYWLVPMRRELQRLEAYGRVRLIRLYMAECPQEMFPLCVWLLGKKADRFRSLGLTNLRSHPSPHIRWHVAKALRRIEAWPALAEMVEWNPHNARLRWLATASTVRRPFRDRLTNYQSGIDDSHADEVATPSRMPFWALERTWEYSPPKSVQVIRRMLRRIRHWVRWGTAEM